MLCYKNGSLAREQIRNEINGDKSSDWRRFNSYLLETNVLGSSEGKKLGFYFPLPEIIPNAPIGTWRFILDKSGVRKADKSDKWTANDDVRAIVESQTLSMRLRAQPLCPSGKLRHVYFVGGASQNSAIVSVMSQVLGSQDGMYRLTEGLTAGACARGSAIKAAWAYHGRGMDFEQFFRKRWNTEGQLENVDIDENRNVWEEYGSVLDAYSQCEEIILSDKR